MLGKKWIAVILIVENIVFEGSESSSLVSFPRFKRQDCGFQCKNGDCILEDKVCDGTGDCKDNSDETTQCLTVGCPSYLFQCAYGACVAKEKECDGKKDCVDNSDETTSKCANLTQGRTCGNEEFKCTSGQCISSDEVCDGKPNCSDNSDETSQICAQVECPSFTFRCDYGACVPKQAQCNRVKDCFDNSDEAKCGNLPTPDVVPTDPDGCLTPAYPENGNWTLVSNSFLGPKQSTSVGTTIEYHCKDGFRPNGKSTKLYSICQNKQWTETDVKCVRLCEELKSTPTTKVTCTYEKKEIPCNEAIEYTQAEFTCKQYYEDTSNSRVRICFDGSWDKAKPECEPICGQKHVDAKPLVVNGTTAEIGDYPWHTALYVKTKDNQFKYQCGGSLISQKMILTAAHCITNLRRGALKDAKNYMVAVGKFYSKYDDPRDLDAQFSEVEMFIVPPQYKGGHLNFQGDIAIIVTVKIFELSDRVQPVCLDRDNSVQLSPSLPGTVVGWGYTIPGTKVNAEEIQELEVPYRDDNDCMTNLPQDFSDKFYLFDKLCSGYKNKSIAVCEGDSGGGLVFPSRKNKGRYYIKGVVSLSPKEEDSCSIQDYALYTKVNEYMSFISRNIVRYEKYRQRN